MAIARHLASIMETYVQARGGDAKNASHPLWSTFKSLQAEVTELKPVRSRDSLRVTWSMGQGGWAKVPWLAVLDEQENCSFRGQSTLTTGRGVYAIYLFREDMSGLYFTLNQGVSELRRTYGRARWKNVVREKSKEIRTHCAALKNHNFQLDNEIDLHSLGGIGKDYEVSTIAHKLYEGRHLPPENEFENDLEVVLKAFDRYLGR